MTRRKVFLAGVTAIFAVAVAGYLALLPRVTVENYQKIHDGMVLSDVEAILGKPTNDRVHPFTYLELCTNISTLRQDYADVEATDETLQWEDGSGTMLVGFRPGGTVIHKRYDPKPDESPLAGFRRWITSAFRW